MILLIAMIFFVFVCWYVCAEPEIRESNYRNKKKEINDSDGCL